MALNFAYYPGCASKEITKEADTSTRGVASRLGIGLHDMDRANCCGAGLMTDYDKELWLSLNARIFAQAEEMQMDIMTICSTCLMVMNTANKRLTEDPAQLERTNKLLASAGLHYSGNVKIKHLYWVLVEDIGMKALKEMVVRPLVNMTVASFYGCHSLRPSDALGFDDPEKPVSLDLIVKTLGALTVDYVGKTKCCGFQIDLVAEETAVEMTGTRVLEAIDGGANCMVTPCPFCHTNLDSYQSIAERHLSKKMDIPVFHLAQLVGLALGMNSSDLGLSRNMVSPEALLK